MTELFGFLERDDGAILISRTPLLSDYVLEKRGARRMQKSSKLSVRLCSAAAAFESLLDKNVFVVGGKNWDALQGVLNGPLPRTNNLKALLNKRPAWEK